MLRTLPPLPRRFVMLVASLLVHFISQTQAQQPSARLSETEFMAGLERFRATGDGQIMRGDYAAALKNYQEAAAFAEKQLGAGNDWTAGIGYTIASLQTRMGRYADAMRVLSASMSALERIHGRENELFTNMLILRGFAQGEIGQIEPGLKDLLAAQGVVSKICPSGHEMAFSVLKRLSRIHMLMKHHAEAEAAARAAIAHLEKHDPQNSAALASARTDLDHILIDTGRWAESRALQELIYPVFKADPALTPADLGYVYESMLQTRISLRDWAGTDRLIEEALAFCERHRATPEFWQASVLTKAADRECKRIDLAAARSYYQRALDVARHIERAEPFAVLLPLSGLGWCAEESGDGALAEKFYQESLRAAVAIGDSQRTHQGMMELAIARLSMNMRDAARAEPHARRALELYRAVFTSDHHILIAPLEMAGHIAYKLGRTLEATRLLVEAGLLAEKYFDRDPDNALNALDTLAYVLRQEGQSNLALPYLDRLVAKAAASGITSGSQLAGIQAGRSLCLRDVRRFDESLAAARESLRLASNSPTEAAVAMRLYHEELVALATWNASQHDAARGLIRERLPAALAEYCKVLATASETQRQVWAANRSPQDLPASFGMAEETASIIGTTKCAVLDSIMSQRRAAAQAAAGDVIVKAAWDAVQDTRQQLGTLLRPGAGDAAEPARVKALQEQMERREQELMRVIGHAPLATVTAEDIAGRLPADAALLDWFRFRRHATGEDSGINYCLVLHRKGKPPVLYDIGPASGVVLDLAALLQNSKTGSHHGAREAARALLARVLGGAARELDGLKTLFLCPDDALQLVPFAVLPDGKGRLLGERFMLRHIASARDLLRDAARLRADAGVEIFAAPQYQARTDIPGSKPLLADLPATRRVAKVIEKIARDAGRECRLRSGAEATEAAARALRAPGVLHLSTHGCYASAPHEELPDPFLYKRNDLVISRLDSPMERCGIALAGAEDALRGITAATSSGTRSDGMLMAAEAAELRLDGTWLVIVDACSTARGALRAGDGVASVQRAFQMAGAEHVAATLWPVFDEPAADFMADFYPRALRDGDAARAWLETQMQHFRATEKESGWAGAFALTGGWVLVSRGR